MEGKGKAAAIVLAAGKGKRMGSEIPKQFLKLSGMDILAYSLLAFEQSPVEEIILVTGSEDIEYCKREIVEKYSLGKVKKMVPGGDERYDSVYAGLLAAEGYDYILIHDGARPLVSGEVITSVLDGAMQYGNCTTGTPVKDTIKTVDSEHFAAETPDRSRLWAVQTPQGFSYPLLREAHEKFRKDENPYMVTDDTMLVEHYMNRKTKLILGDYRNLKVTTPEDLVVARAYLASKE